MSQPALSPSKQTLPHDTNGNIDVSEWAKANLDQDIITGTSADLKAQQELLRAEYFGFPDATEHISLIRIPASPGTAHNATPTVSSPSTPKATNSPSMRPMCT
ncbi:hypothetical protein PMIN03_012398 [Paraphaeosphaeria minitans]